MEAELVFFAQADDGTVWHLGQYPESYVDGVLDEVPTWIHGLQDARAGIIMQATPQLGTPSYSQGWGPRGRLHGSRAGDRNGDADLCSVRLL